VKLTAPFLGLPLQSHQKETLFLLLTFHLMYLQTGFPKFDCHRNKKQNNEPLTQLLILNMTNHNDVQTTSFSAD